MALFFEVDNSFEVICSLQVFDDFAFIPGFDVQCNK